MKKIEIPSPWEMEPAEIGTCVILGIFVLAVVLAFWPLILVGLAVGLFIDICVTVFNLVFAEK